MTELHKSIPHPAVSIRPPEKEKDGSKSSITSYMKNLFSTKKKKKKNKSNLLTEELDEEEPEPEPEPEPVKKVKKVKENQKVEEVQEENVRKVDYSLADLVNNSIRPRGITGKGQTQEQWREALGGKAKELITNYGENANSIKRMTQRELANLYKRKTGKSIYL